MKRNGDLQNRNFISNYAANRKCLPSTERAVELREALTSNAPDILQKRL